MRPTWDVDTRAPAVLPGRQELERRIESTLRLVLGNLRRLDQYVEFWPESNDIGGRLEDKIASESALLVMLVHRVARAGSPLAELARELGELLARLLRTDRNRIAMLRSPQAASTLGLGHVYLQNAGFPDPSWEPLVRRLFAEGYADMKERQPHRILDRRWARELMELAPDRDDGAIVPFTIVSGRAHPLYMSSSDAYAYTHVLMYLSDFGRRSLRPLVDSVRVTAVVDACLSWTLLEEDLDLLGEFLLGYVLLGQEWSPEAQLAYWTLETVGNRFGFLPGPTFDESAFLSLEPGARSAYAFKETYHTTLVAAVVAAVLLGQNRDALFRPPRPPAPPTNLVRKLERAILRGIRYGKPAEQTGVAEDCEVGRRPAPSLPALVNRARRAYDKSRDSTPVWAEVASSGLVEPAAVRRVLLQGLMIGAVRRYDLAEIAHSLDDAIALGEGDSLTFQETVQFLLHQQLESGAIGAHFVDETLAASSHSRDVTLGLTACLLHAYRYLTED